MKFKLNIQNREILLTYEQLDRLTDVLHGSDVLSSEYVGSSKGDDGTNYMRSVRPLDTSDLMLAPIHDDLIEALRLKTKLYDEAKDR